MAAEGERIEADRRRTFGAAIGLARRRLAERGPARIGRVLAALVFVGFAATAIVLRVSGGDGPGPGLVAIAARTLLWLTAVPIALAAAADLRAVDRREGIEALAAARGLSERGLGTARFFAAMIHTSWLLALPLGLLAIVTIGVGDLRQAGAHVAQTIGALVFAVVAGIVVGGLGAACGRAARRRGPRVVLAIIVLPWLVADALGHTGISIPGALDAVLAFALGLPSGGA